MTQARILRLQTLRPDTDNIHHDIALISTFSVVCPKMITGGVAVFERE